METASQDAPPRTFSIKLWPPSESTRLMLVEKMTINLSTESIFSKKYGLLSKEEASENAKRIEEVCFASANEHFMKEPDGDGSSAVQLYAKETSKLMLEVLKRGPRLKEEAVAEADFAEKPPTLAKTTFDISGGRRAFIDAEEARELLSPLTEQGNSYTKICFSNRSFGIDAARVAEPILASIKNQLIEVDLSDFIAGRPEDEALDVMRIFSSALEGCKLKYLNLSDNALGEKGVRAFEGLLRSQDSLEELYLMNDGISEEAAKALAELIPSTEKLKILHFHNNMTGDEGAVAISEVLMRSPLLENFRCSSTRVGSDGGIALAEALETCTNLKKLDLRDNIFGVEAGIALSKTLEKLSGITEIYLSYLNLEDDGTIAIANVLKQSAPALEVLEIGGNDITAEAAPALAECVATKSFLKKLSLCENELKDSGAIIIGKALESNAQLKELDMSANMIRRAGARCLAQAVANKPAFVLLNIDGNAISDEGIDEVKEILKAGKNSVDVLGPLDENDAEGEGEEGEEEEEGDESELESKLEHLKVEED
ncbi:RAN GTPase-activating protein 2-like [Ananas comosus]|uniref:RAN GTPase-activating protein 2-like n=1 Tax=Ananas comosus TaxID=4615 RepID=A0A6P5G3W8_ANACO|nr:RAN GTPase-activating protein 2-like [Ananas comosus]